VNDDPNVVEVTAEPPPPKRSWTAAVHRWWNSKWRDLRGPFWVVLLLGLFLVGWLFDSIFVNVMPGHAGVLWRRFSGGTDMTHVYGGGLWIINPFNKFYIYETRLQQRETEFTALSTNGLTLNIRASVRFRPIVKDLPLLQEQVGPDYIERVVISQVQSVIRKVIGTYAPDQIYGSQGNILQNVVFTALAELRARHIELDDLLIREVRLTPKMANAIENKLEQEQIAIQFDYLLEREHKEAKRKKIEAEGILQFQRTVAKDLTENYLKLRGIDASLALAKSPNAKVVVFGSGAGGLPLILNVADAPAVAPAAAPADIADQAPPAAPPPSAAKP
jgi:prohibitin 2